MNKIIEVLKDIGKGEVQPDGKYYYNAEKLIKYASDVPWWLITGERRIGKTHLFTQLAIELYNRLGWQTAWVRNNKVEFKEGGFLGDFMNAPLRFGWITEDWKCDEEGLKDPDGNVAIKFVGLSCYSNYRGNEHPNIHLIFMDEMQREDRRSIKRPHIGMMSLAKTMLSGKDDTMVIMASNRISATNGFFLGFKVYPDPKYSVTVFRDKGIAIETCRKGDYHSNIAKENPHNAVYRAGGYGDYADDDADDLMTLVRPVPKGAKPADETYLIDGTVYVGFVKDGLMYYAESGHPKEYYLKRRDFMFTPNLTECSENVYKLWASKKKELLTMYEAGVMRFSTANVMMAIMSMLYSMDV